MRASAGEWNGFVGRERRTLCDTLHVFTAPFGTGFVNSQLDGGHPYCPCPAFAGASTAGIFASRTSLLKAARSVVSRPFKAFSSAFALVARSSYTMLDCAVGWLSELSTTPSTCASLLFSLIGKFRGSSLARFLVWYNSSSTTVSFWVRALAASA